MHCQWQYTYYAPVKAVGPWRWSGVLSQALGGLDPWQSVARRLGARPQPVPPRWQEEGGAAAGRGRVEPSAGRDALVTSCSGCGGEVVGDDLVLLCGCCAVTSCPRCGEDLGIGEFDVLCEVCGRGCCVSCSDSAYSYNVICDDCLSEFDDGDDDDGEGF